MKRYEEKTVTKVEKQEIETLCDRCGKRVGGHPNIMIQNTSGDGHYAITDAFDCCEKCWKEAIVPQFKTGPETF